MLSKFTLANFKSYREATLDLSPLTLLIGANASGKSNALEAMQMFSWLSRRGILQELVPGQRLGMVAPARGQSLPEHRQPAAPD